DVSLGTFYVFDKENESQLGQGIRLAARGGGRCGGCGGGGRCAAARCGGGGRCAVARCATARCAVARCAGGCGCGGGCGGCGGRGGWGGDSPGGGRRRRLRRKLSVLAVDERWLGLGLPLRKITTAVSPSTAP